MALDAKLISRSNDPSHQEAPTDAEAVTTTAAAGPGQWRLLYFDAPTRGEQLRLLFRLAKQPFDDVRLVWPSGIAPYKHAALGDASPLLFDQCPMVTSPDGHHIAQTAAAMQFVGRRLGLAPAGGDDGGVAADARALALTLGAEELRNAVFYKLLIPAVAGEILRRRCCGLFCWLRWPINAAFGVGGVVRSLAGRLALFEAALRDGRAQRRRAAAPDGDEDGGGGAAGSVAFLCGEAPCYADVAVFDCVREIVELPGVVDRAAALAPFPLLAALVTHLEATPELAGYLAERGPAAVSLAARYA